MINNYIVTSEVIRDHVEAVYVGEQVIRDIGQVGWEKIPADNGPCWTILYNRSAHGIVCEVKGKRALIAHLQ